MDDCLECDCLLRDACAKKLRLSDSLILVKCGDKVICHLLMGKLQVFVDGADSIVYQCFEKLKWKRDWVDGSFVKPWLMS